MTTFRNDLHLGQKVPTVETDDITNGAVTHEKLADEAVDTNNILDGAVTPEKLSEDVRKEVIGRPISELSKRIDEVEKESKEKDDDLQNQIDSIQIHGMAVSNDFGDDPNIGISQKKLTEAHDDLDSRLRILEVSKAMVSLSISPDYVMTNEKRTVTFTAVSDVMATSIRIIGNDEVLAHGEDTKSVVFTLEDFISGTTMDMPVLAEFTFSDIVKTVEGHLRAVDPVFYGAGASWQAAGNKASLRETPAGEYKVSTVQDGNYVFFNVPDGMVIHEATLNGFRFPLDDPESVTIGGKPYWSYRSSNTYDASVLTIVIS